MGAVRFLGIADVGFGCCRRGFDMGQHHVKLFRGRVSGFGFDCLRVSRGFPFKFCSWPSPRGRRGV